MKIVSSPSTFAVQVASFSEGEGIFRWFNTPHPKSNYFDVTFDLVRNASTAKSIDQMDDLGSVKIRVWYDGIPQFVEPPLIFSHPYHDHIRFIGQISWFLVSIGMSLKNPHTQSSSPIAAREKKKWGTAMKVFRSAAHVPGTLCIPPEEWEVLRILEENPLLYCDTEFKEWALSRSDQSM